MKGGNCDKNCLVFLGFFVRKSTLCTPCLAGVSNSDTKGLLYLGGVMLWVKSAMKNGSTISLLVKLIPFTVLKLFYTKL